MESAVAVRGLSVSRDGREVLCGVDLDIGEGELVSIVGQPGSGRTSLVRVLVGLTKPDAGHASIFGLDCWDDAIALQRRISYAPSDIEVWPQLSVAETLGFLDRLDETFDQQRCQRLLSVTGVDQQATVGEIGPHQRRLVSLVAALCRPADLVVVDNALTGLAADTRRRIREVLWDVHRGGATVILTGVPQDGLELISDRFFRMSDGRLSPPIAGAVSSSMLHTV